MTSGCCCGGRKRIQRKRGPRRCRNIGRRNSEHAAASTDVEIAADATETAAFTYAATADATDTATATAVACTTAVDPTVEGSLGGPRALVHCATARFTTARFEAPFPSCNTVDKHAMKKKKRKQ